MLTQSPLVSSLTSHQSVTNLLQLPGAFELECGEWLKEAKISYTTYGELSQRRDNVVWVFHTLTTNSDPREWWPQMFVGKGCLNRQDLYIVCANVFGSCYGSTGPMSLDSKTGRPYGKDFPLVTVRDMVRAHQRLAEHLGISSIALGIGGSLGGQQLLTWATEQPSRFERLCVVAASCAQSPWAIAFNETQRMALRADETFHQNATGGHAGLAVARAIAMLSYRSHQKFAETQGDDVGVREGHRASSYQNYQGQKFAKRFCAHSYYSLTRSMDTHDIGWRMPSREAALRLITAPSLVVGFSSDLLFPIVEQAYLVEHLRRGILHQIATSYGHDATLAEGEKLSSRLSEFLTDSGMDFK